MKKHKNEIIRKGTYEATYTQKDELKVVGFNKIPKESEVLSVNKYFFKGNLIKLTTSSGKELIVTPEHKVAIKSFFNRIKYIQAEKVKFWHKVITLN